MCEGYWDARSRRWVSLEELEQLERDALLVEGVAFPTIMSSEPRRKPVAVQR